MKNWFQLQKNLYLSIKKEALSYLGRKPAAFKTYEKEFLKDQSKLKDSSTARLVSAINRSDILFIGDFHTLRQSQRFLLRLLRDKSLKRPTHIGFEILENKHLKDLHAWLKKPSIEAEQRLKASLNLEQRFGTHFETYREIFQKLDEWGIEIFPLASPKSSLIDRDKDAAKKLASIDGRVWVLFGEYHCARTHLPQRLIQNRKDLKILVLQQNDDRCAERRFKEIHETRNLVLEAPPISIVKHQSHPIFLFCVLHTPLWIKYQSYLENHLQNYDDIDDHAESSDPHDQIRWSIKTLISFLKDPRYPEKTDLNQVLDFSVYGARQSHFFKSLSRLPSQEKALILEQIRQSGIAILQTQRLIYLSEFTINSCSQAAGLYLYLSWSKTKIQRNEFYKRTLVEALAFFCSKLLNHSRLAPSWSQWMFITQKSKQKTKEAHAILRSRTFIKNTLTSSDWKKKLGSNLGQASLVLGRNLADSLFEAFLAQEFSLTRLIRILKTKIITEEEAFEILVEFKSASNAFVKTLRKRSKAL